MCALSDWKDAEDEAFPSQALELVLSIHKQWMKKAERRRLRR